ncbi:hypothetical protein AK812_SmicGene37537 [Symbiodinium microadriaticum]|uniref:Endo-beta-1,2-glucanase SGL domain-containing protein n=1 Tax=Symbiodinium microadriaticum TaxID=2951 RepID=A0A1Q9CG19_SYMMI|nr:hypothetical protein AK812_SmicGene37537 [Symbiodinium microadriaticum]
MMLRVQQAFRALAHPGLRPISDFPLETHEKQAAALPLLYSTDEALDILEKKAPCSARKGGSPKSSVFQAPQTLEPAGLPGLDNGQLAFGTAAVVCRFAQMARRWNGRLERMKVERASVVNLFYDGAGLVARNASNAHNQNQMVLWDAFEGEMWVVIFMDIFGNWSKYPNNGEELRAEEKKLMWKIKAEHVEPVVYTAADNSKMVLQKGQAPFHERRVRTLGEFIATAAAVTLKPGLMASVNAPHGLWAARCSKGQRVQCDAHPYCSAVGIQALAEQPIFTARRLESIQPLDLRGAPASSIIASWNVAPMATWDAKATTAAGSEVVAMLGGTGPLLRTYMQEHGVYGVFEDRVKSMYASLQDALPDDFPSCRCRSDDGLKSRSSRMKEQEQQEEVLQVCDELGIETAPAEVAAGMFIVPMQSWYSRDFISKALRQQHASATDADAKVTIDQWIQWPFPCGSDDAWKFFMRMNEAALRATLVAKTAFERFCDQPAQVMTMTHFLTRPELSFDWTIPGIWDHIGCEGLDEQIRTIGSDVHVYGRACTGPQVQEIDGLSYVHNYIGSTEKHRPGMAPFCIFDRGEILPTTQPSQANGFNFQPSARPQEGTRDAGPQLQNCFPALWAQELSNDMITSSASSLFLLAFAFIRILRREGPSAEAEDKHRQLIIHWLQLREL